MIETKFIKKAKYLIDRASVISFDIFDTLLLRPYIRPTDLFLHIEKSENMPFFCVSRMDAEREARRKHINTRQDITLDMIYDEISDVFKPLKEKEMAMEMLVLRANPEMKAVWDYAKAQGKKIVIASDMYLPDDFISSVLEKNGFSGYEKLYVSGSLGKTKGSGEIYSMILSDFNINPNDVLHIGDNKRSDVKRPISMGIPAIRYRQVTRQFIKQNPRAKAFNSMTWNDMDLGSSVIISLCAKRWQETKLGLRQKDYWEDIGYTLGGPSIYGYMRWALRKANQSGIEHLLFVARDGYTLQKVFDSFNSAIKTDYVYAPRFLNLVCRLDYEPKNGLQGMAIINYFKEKDAKIAELAKSIDFSPRLAAHEFIEKNKSLFIPLAQKELDNYKKYMGKIVKNGAGNIGLVDTITGGYSSQKILQTALGGIAEITGFYWGVLKLMFNGRFRYKAFAGSGLPNGGNISGKPAEIFTKNWDFMEFLITSPEYPVENITEDGQPVYTKTPSPYEIVRSKLYNNVMQGELDFANDVQKMFGGADIFLGHETVIKNIDSFINHPSKEDKKNMVILYQSVGATHSDYMPMFNARIPINNMIIHPKRSVRLIKRCLWRTPLQSLVICIFKPIKARVGKFKKIELVLFPKLLRRYLTISLNLSENIKYRILIGNSSEGDQ